MTENFENIRMKLIININVMHLPILIYSKEISKTKYFNLQFMNIHSLSKFSGYDDAENPMDMILYVYVFIRKHSLRHFEIPLLKNEFA